MPCQRQNALVAVEWTPGDLRHERSVPVAEACGLRFHRGGHAVGTLPLDRLPSHDSRGSIRVVGDGGRRVEPHRYLGGEKHEGEEEGETEYRREQPRRSSPAETLPHQLPMLLTCVLAFAPAPSRMLRNKPNAAAPITATIRMAMAMLITPSARSSMNR